MNFLARLGVGLITGLVSYGLVPAAYAVATPMTHPNGVTTSAASQDCVSQSAGRYSGSLVGNVMPSGCDEYSTDH